MPLQASSFRSTIVPRCSCEEVAHGSLGAIDDGEPISRLVFSPDHIRSADSTLKPGAFPLSHIREKGLSLVRNDKISNEDLAAFANAMAKSTPARTWHGYFKFQTACAREMTDRNGLRSVCVFDDPTSASATLPANPAHAILISADGKMSEADAKEIRSELLEKGTLLLSF